MHGTFLTMEDTGPSLHRGTTGASTVRQVLFHPPRYWRDDRGGGGLERGILHIEMPPLPHLPPVTLELARYTQGGHSTRSRDAQQLSRAALGYAEQACSGDGPKGRTIEAVNPLIRCVSGAEQRSVLRPNATVVTTFEHFDWGVDGPTN